MKHDQRVQSVVTAHELMEALASRSEGMGLTELARAARMTPSRVLRHLKTLLELQLVERAETDATYRLGAGLIRLGERAAMQHDVSRAAFPVLRRLNDRFGLATFLVRRQGDRALVWLSLPSLEVPHLTMPPGMTFSLTGSSAGRVLLAFGEESELPLGPEPAEDFPDPMPDKVALDERLATIRRAFFEHHGVDRSTALHGLAVPVLRHDEAAMEAIAVVGLSLATRAQWHELVSALLQAGAQVSRQLGSRSAYPERPR